MLAPNVEELYLTTSMVIVSRNHICAALQDSDAKVLLLSVPTTRGRLLFIFAMYSICLGEVIQSSFLFRRNNSGFLMVISGFSLVFKNVWLTDFPVSCI